MNSVYNVTCPGGSRMAMAVVALILLGAGAAEAAVILGTVYTDEGVTNTGAGLTVRLIVNGVDSGTDVTDAAGAYSIVATLSAGDAMLVYVDGGSIDATTVTVSDGADLSGFDIYADHVIARHDNSGTLSNADMDTAKGSFSDAEIEYSVTAGAVTVPSPNELYVPTGYTFAPGADVTAYAIEILGTVNGGADTFTVQADWLASSGSFNAGTSSVEFTSGDATFTPGASSYYDVAINLSPAQTLTLGSSLDVDHDLTITAETLDVSVSNYAVIVGGNFTNLDAFTARSGTVMLDGTGQSILGSTAFYNLTKSVAVAETLTFQAGQTTTINGTATLTGAAGNLLSLRSDTPGTRWNFTVSAGAIKAIDYVDVQDSDASGSDPSKLPIVPTNSADSGNNVDWFMLTISGTVYTDEGVTNVGAGLTVRMIANGVDVGSDVTDATGAYSVTASVHHEVALLVYVDAGAIDGTTVTVLGEGDLSGFDIYADHVITRQDNGGALSNADMDTAKGSYVDDEIEYSVTGGVLTVSGPNELYVPTGHTFDPDEDVSTYDVEILGTLNLSNLTISVERDWVAGSGTISGPPAGPSQVLFISGSATFVPGPSPYPKVIVSLSPGSILTLGGALDVDNFLHIDSGALDVSASNYAIFLGKAFRNLDTFTARSGTVTFDGTGQKIQGSTTFYNLTKSVAVTETLTFQASQTTTINGTVTLSGAAGNLLSLRSDTPGTRWNFIVAAGATKVIDYVDVQDSDASGSDASQKPIEPTNSVDSGNTLDWFSSALAIRVMKTVTTLEDPVNGITDPKAIPRAIVLYTVQLTNLSTGPADADSVTISDPIPADLSLRVVDYDGGNPGPVAFVDGSPSSGLTYTFISLGSSTDDVEFSNDGGSTWTYTPVDSGDGTDPAVTDIRVNPKGIFAGSGGGGDPSFQLLFKAIVQ